VLREKAPKSYYGASVDDHIAQAATPKQAATPTPEPTGGTPDLHSALHAIGTELLKGHDQPATLGTIGFAFRHVASKIKETK